MEASRSDARIESHEIRLRGVATRRHGFRDLHRGLKSTATVKRRSAA